MTMSSTQLSPHALAALNDNELEILHLLANGHTAKSIAARLGRSETAIHERLRDARRKTGVGSSRELARMLDAQKIWDRKIDLSLSDTSAETGPQPRDAGRRRLKGKIIMLAALPLAAAGIIMAATSTHIAEPQQAAHVAAPDDSPLQGRWALDVDRIPADERPQRVTIEFSVSADRKWTTHVEIVAPDGSTSRAQSTAALDGVAAPVTGNMAFVDTVSLRQPAPGTLVMTLARDGSPVSTRVYTVARDRKSMTETIVWAGESVPKLETTHFNRVG